MKTLKAITIFIFINIIVSCKNNNESLSDKKQVITIINNIEINNKLLNSIYKYLDDSINTEYNVFIARVLSYDYETIVMLSPVKSSYTLRARPSSLCIKYGNKNVFIYLGIERIIIPNSSFIDRYYKNLLKIETEFNISGKAVVFDPYPFFIRIINDSIIYNDKLTDGSVFLSPSSRNVDLQYFLPSPEDTIEE